MAHRLAMLPKNITAHAHVRWQVLRCRLPDGTQKHGASSYPGLIFKSLALLVIPIGTEGGFVAHIRLP